jgi:hypothetical protein
VKKNNTSGEKKKHIGQGGCSSAKRAERAHPQLVHWWVLIHSSPQYVTLCKYISHPSLVMYSSYQREGLALSLFLVPSGCFVFWPCFGLPLLSPLCDGQMALAIDLLFDHFFSFAAPPGKLKLGQQIGGGLLIANL